MRDIAQLMDCFKNKINICVFHFSTSSTVPSASAVSAVHFFRHTGEPLTSSSSQPLSGFSMGIFHALCRMHAMLHMIFHFFLWPRSLDARPVCVFIEMCAGASGFECEPARVHVCLHILRDLWQQTCRF